MQKSLQQRGFMDGLKKRVSWNGGVQWLLVFALLAPTMLGVQGASVPAVAQKAVEPKALASARQSRIDRIDPRIIHKAFNSPAQMVRVIVQKLGQDQALEQKV